MTVGKLREILSAYGDNDRIILDIDGYRVTKENEVVSASKIYTQYPPVIVLQTRNDLDVEEELRGFFEVCENENVDETDALTELIDLGYTLEDLELVDRDKWAIRVAKEHGLDDFLEGRDDYE